MKKAYYKQMIDILTDRPEGLKVSTIAIHIYNQNGGLFVEDGLYEKIYESIRQFLWQQSQKKHSPFMAVKDKRGYYKLRYQHKVQGEFNFEENYQEQDDNQSAKDEAKYEQTSLFDLMNEEE